MDLCIVDTDVVERVSSPHDNPTARDPLANGGTRSPLEGHSAYRGEDWTPERLAFHQNLEQFAERVGLIVGLQGNGKVSQEEAFTEIRAIWKSLKSSKSELLQPPEK